MALKYWESQKRTVRSREKEWRGQTELVQMGVTVDVVRMKQMTWEGMHAEWVPSESQCRGTSWHLVQKRVQSDMRPWWEEDLERLDQSGGSTG
ncbi:hypothetical protein F0562_010938 [Nyssa sinensis]|uniref:Uncharacterized protein n=1 Tax=Nyssa sinensis TaxID=561372 RepID=A0A5J5A0A5_9ASTE|nr:hypothetical protein F0562_010938 [Nyssa sinensis]